MIDDPLDLLAADDCPELTASLKSGDESAQKFAEHMVFMGAAKHERTITVEMEGQLFSVTLTAVCQALTGEKGYRA
jgi:hypothetical protein